jgi:large subunit ribosomal protein L30e
MTSIADIIQAEKKKKALYGSDRTIKALKNGKLAEVILSSNCPDRTVDLVKNLAKLSNTKINKSKHDSKELGVACKKPFSVTIIGLLK